MSSRRSVLLGGALVVLGAPAVVLTTVRALDLDDGLALQAQAFTPYALVLYAALLVLLLLSLPRARGSRAPRVVLVLAVVAALGVHAWWFSPQVVGEAPRPEPGAEEVVVMTANVLQGGADAVSLVRSANDDDVDVLVVSEITEGFVAGMERAGLDDLFPHRAGTPGVGDLQVDGTMVFSRSEIEEVAELDTLFDSLVVRTAGLTLIGTHPAPPTQPDDWRRDHDLLLAGALEHQPDVILGDLNATPDHQPVRALSAAGWRDSVDLTNGVLQPTWPTSGFPVLGLLPPSVAIDHVLVRDTWAVLDTHTVDLPDSDHRPVVATVARAR